MSGERPISVLHVFNYFTPDFSGESIYVTRMLPLLDARGVRSDVLVKRTHPSKAGVRSLEETEPAPHTVHYMPARRSRILESEIQLAWWMLRFGRRYDVVHYHAWCDRYMLSQLFARMWGARVVQSCTLDDGPSANLASYKPRWRRAVQRLYRLISAFVSISPRLHRDGEGLVPESRNLLIPQGVAVPETPRPGRSGARARHGLRGDDVALLFVGGICARKDVVFLVRAMRRLVEAGSPVKLFLVGPVLEDSYADEVEWEIGSAGLADRVVVAGYHADPTEFYALADVFVFASTNEGFGNVLLEAMAHGLPVVSRRLEHVTDWFIDDGETGFLFEDEAGYLSILDRLIGDPALGERVGRGAREAVIERFGIDAIAARYVDLYRSK